MNLIILIGHTGQGKTFFLNNEFLKNSSRTNPRNIEKSLYSLTPQSNQQYIFDLNNEYELPNDFGGFKKFMRHTECDDQKFINNCKQLRNYNIVFEDATGFLRGKQTATFARLLISKIHTGNNYFLLFHSINRVPPEIMEMCNYVFLFKTVENIDNLKKFNNENLKQAFLTLQKEKQYSHRVVKMIN